MITVGQAALHLMTALGLGALIGAEREWGHHDAGLRTNTLVSLGAAGFVLFESMFTTGDPTRIAAQVVSGIGFLGAGVIFRNGTTVQGLTTAATLWCSSAVGLLAGIGALPYACLLAGCVVSSNLILRPIVRTINKHSIKTT